MNTQPWLLAVSVRLAHEKGRVNDPAVAAVGELHGSSIQKGLYFPNEPRSINLKFNSKLNYFSSTLQIED